MALSEYKPTTYTDFSNPDNKNAMLEALKRVKSELGGTYDLIIGGEHIEASATFESRNPSDIDEVIGVFQKAGAEEANMAVDAATEAFGSWSQVPAEERADFLVRGAALMRERRLELAAWMVYEVGKNWVEADADVAETIDFFEYYAREAIRYSGRKPQIPFPGEENWVEYIPLGVGVVIPPWNFPLAITSGMTAAAIVSGNTVVLKPSSDAPATGYQLMRIMEEIGLPAGALNYLSGPGALAGDILVKHPKTRFIAFTGSMEVGLGINKAAAQVVPGQIWIKRVVVEMGGKDAIIVDSEADLDSAVAGVTASAFGYGGQKCSACSRAIIVDSVYDEFAVKLVERVEQLDVMNPEDGEASFGPVINEGALNKVQEYVEIGKSEGKLLTGGRKVEGNGYYHQPTVFGDIDRKARLAQEEIFGPVLALLRAKDYEDALNIANDSIYGLTGAVYSKNQEKLEKAAKKFHVGNLYFNRKCTGALVGVQPFGGFNMSGTDSKAGGSDYLLLFQQAKSICEKVLN